MNNIDLSKITDENANDMIVSLRKSSGLSKTKFAERFHIPESTYSQWENGKRTPPTYVVQLIAELLQQNQLIEQYEMYVKCNPFGMNIPLSEVLDYIVEKLEEEAEYVAECAEEYADMTGEHMDLCDLNFPVRLHFGDTVVSGFVNDEHIKNHGSEMVRAYKTYKAVWGKCVDIHMVVDESDELNV